MKTVIERIRAQRQRQADSVPDAKWSQLGSLVDRFQKQLSGFHNTLAKKNQVGTAMLAADLLGGVALMLYYLGYPQERQQLVRIQDHIMSTESKDNVEDPEFGRRVFSSTKP